MYSRILLWSSVLYNVIIQAVFGQLLRRYLPSQSVSTSSLSVKILCSSGWGTDQQTVYKVFCQGKGVRRGDACTQAIKVLETIIKVSGLSPKKIVDMGFIMNVVLLKIAQSQ